MSSNSKIGTPHAQYAPPSDGPFLCIVCRHFKLLKGKVEGNCDHPEVMEDAKAGYLPIVNNLPVTHHEGCCSYFQKSPIDASKLAGLK